MVRLGTRARVIATALLGLAILAGAAPQAGAQGLPALTVTALSMGSSRAVVPAGVAFTIRIHMHVTQHLTEIPWLVLPNVDNLTILGDEKHTMPVKGDGTDYIEILSVAAIAPGEASLTPAYIDARDPSRGGKPFRFSSNALKVAVRGDAASNPTEAFAERLKRAALRLLRTVGVALAVLVATIVLVLLLFIVIVRLRGRMVMKDYVTLPVARPVQAVKPSDPSATIRTALGRLAGVRSRDNAAAVRRALFAYAGARSEETLSALLDRVPSDQTALRTALRAAERATFVDESNLTGAIDELLDAVRRMGLG